MTIHTKKKGGNAYLSDVKINLQLFNEGAQAFDGISTPSAANPDEAADPTTAAEHATSAAQEASTLQGAQDMGDDIDPSYADDPAWQQYVRIQNARFAAKSAALARSCAQTANIYPAFDLQEEMRNPRFLRLIDAGLSVRESYEVLHRDTLLQQAVQAAAEKTRRQIYQEFAAKRSRVEENGASPALVTKKDPASMSRHQREQIAKRVMRGEKVTF